MAKKKPTPLDDHIKKVKLIREASQSLKDYNALLDKTREIQTNINFIDGKQKIVKQELINLEAKHNALKAAGHVFTPNELDAHQALVDSRKTEINDLEEILNISNRNLEIHRDAVDEVKVMAVAFKDVGRQVGRLGKKLIAQKGYLLEQQKAVKGTELSMGILSNQADVFRKNIYKASLTTTAIGLNTADLAQIQGTYTDNIGRGVQLSEEQLIAMGELAKGTVLGAEGAAEFAANMDSFNISAEGSAELIDDMLKTSHKMGVASSKVIKNVQKNMKLLHKYNFKGGVKGLTKMAALTTKFKFEMQSIADFAENLITPEGAVEAAAKLQVLGGAWAKLGDPFELMYRSRNDLGGLTEDIINATKETARFDDVTGEISIDPMELHRLREVANATGLEFESLAESAKMAAKFSKIESGMSSMFTKEDKEYLSGIANWDEKDKEFKVKMRVGDEMVEESVNALKRITPEIVKSQAEYQQTLKKNAEQAMTFAERWEGLENMFRSVLLPGFEAFANALEHSIGDFHKWSVESGFAQKLVDFGTWVGELAGGLIKFVADNPIKSLIGLGGGYLIGKTAMWYARGVQLGIGFNTVAGGGFGGMFGKGASSSWKPGQIGMSMGDKLAGKGFMGGKFAAGTMGSLAGGVGLGLGGMALDYGRSKMDDPNSTGGKALGVGSSALKGAGIGMMLGPVGAGVGALLGGLYGAYKEFGEADKNIKKGNSMNDFISRPGEDAVPFSSNDTLIGAKTDGPIDKLLNQGSNNGVSSPGENSINFDANSLIKNLQKDKTIDKLVEDKKVSKGNGDKVSVEFNKPLKIEGKIELSSNGDNVEVDLNDPILMRDLSKVIQEQLSKAISGGKVSSNPVVLN